MRSFDMKLMLATICLFLIAHQMFAQPADMSGTTKTPAPTTLGVSDNAPTISEISPSSKYAGEAAFVLSVRGTNFNDHSNVRWDGSQRPTEFITRTELRVSILSTDISIPGKYTVTVRNSEGEGNISHGRTFIVLRQPIGGTVYDDLNENGSRDGGENGLSTWKVWLLKDDIAIDSTSTTSEGDFGFNNTSPGTYNLRLQMQSGWAQTQPSQQADQTVILADSVAVPETDFGVFKDTRISGLVFDDRNEDGIQESDEILLSRIPMRVLHGDDTLSMETENDGTFSLSHLHAGAYTVCLNLGSGWFQTYPKNEYLITVVSGTDASGISFGVSYALRNTEMYRTFLPEDISVPKAIRPIRFASKFSFEFQNLIDQQVDGLHVEFATAATSINLAEPFVTVRAKNEINREFDFAGATVEKSQTVEVSGIGPRFGMKVKKWWWTYNGIRAGIQNPGLLPSKQVFLLPMPNGANLRNEIFLRMAYQSAPPNVSSPGMIIGVPQPANLKLYGWVFLRRSYDALRSLRGSFGLHTGEARGFEKLNNGWPFKGEQKGLPPTRHNNRLFSDLVTLKLNISASELQLTPVGLGELLFEEDNNPLRGMTVREIATYADTALTYWLGRPQSEYLNLDSTIRKINAAFSGPVDTVSFVPQLSFTGERKLLDVPFLRKNPHVATIMIVTHSPAAQEAPLGYALEQNYPNPFNPTTSIEFEIAQSSTVTLKIFNMLGQEVTTLLENELMAEGRHSVEFNATGLASGMYFYRFVALMSGDDESASQKPFIGIRRMLLVK